MNTNGTAMPQTRQTDGPMNIETLYAQDAALITLSLVDRLIDCLNQAGVSYCHWKSNIDLAQGLAGEIDIDLLVNRRDLLEIQAILAALGFKQAQARWGEKPPSILHYYGLEPASKHFVHIHLFSRVLTGESFVKTHLLPFETMLLEDVDEVGALKVASKPAELVLFTLRMFIKYGSLFDLLTLRRKSKRLQEEARWLMNDSDRRMLGGNSVPDALALLKTHCPVIPEPLFMRCLAALDSRAPLLARVRLAQQVRRRLAVYTKHSAWGRMVAYGRWGWAEVQRRLGGKRQNKVLQSGGALIAFVGADATGKSTLVAETTRWLGSTFTTSTIHSGKPPSAWLTAPINLALALTRRAASPQRQDGASSGADVSATGDGAQHHFRGPASLIVALRAVSLAWDRRRLLRRARRRAAAGELVICDRYPSHTLGAMDSPRLAEVAQPAQLAARLYNRLARMEQRIYGQIAPPDIVLRLRVSLETALQRNRARNGQDGEGYLAARHRQSQAWHLSGTRTVYDIDTEQPLAETIAQVKESIWTAL